MTVYLWVMLVLGIIRLICNALLAAAGTETTVGPSNRVWWMITGGIITVWTAYLLFIGGAA